MPVAASPSYHGYDVSDYYRVEPAYGTNDDFKRLVAEAHRRGIAILIDMVLNHSSSEHPAFQAALRDTTSPVPRLVPIRTRAARQGPVGADAWHKSPIRNEYYYGPFWSGMPDLNYHSPRFVRKRRRSPRSGCATWGWTAFDSTPSLPRGGRNLSDGLRRHAVRSCTNTRGVHQQALQPPYSRRGVGKHQLRAALLPDQLTSYFGFELADSLVAAVRRGSVGGMLSGYLRLQDTLPAYRWSPFLSNHDGTRVMTLLGGDMARAKIAATLLLTLPGLPFVYYGEEIGMSGDKPDPRLRTPMQWSSGRAAGFTTGTPWEALQPDTQAINVAAEDADPNSLLNLYRRLINVRRSNDALATGRLVPLTSGGSEVVAYLRRAGEKVVLVVANLGSAAVTGCPCNRGKRDVTWHVRSARARRHARRRDAGSWPRGSTTRLRAPHGPAGAEGKRGVRPGASVVSKKQLKKFLENPRRVPRDSPTTFF
jgi:hypothetical protein